MAKALLGSLDGLSADALGEPPDSLGQERLPFATLAQRRSSWRRRALRATVSRVAGALVAHPLVLGAALLFVLSTAAGNAAWGFPHTAQLQTLGGEAVEVNTVENEGGAARVVSDAAVILGSSAFTDAETPSTPPETFDFYADASLFAFFTTPWTSANFSGASGRGAFSYTIVEDDTLSSIAMRFGVSVRAIAWSNDIVDPDAIKPGDTLRVPPVNGVLHVVKKGETLAAIAKKYGADEEKILSFNALPADGTLTAGDELVVPGGQPPAPPPPPKPKPSPRPSAPQFAASQVPLGYYIAPTTGRNYGRRHSQNGVDIANSCGTPVYAAASGVVSRANWSGWGGGYGIYIDINHPNGTQTRYAHLSQIVVGSGQVGQGQLIGLMGTTGRSTGCHLHFEVHGAKNPLAR